MDTVNITNYKSEVILLRGKFHPELAGKQVTVVFAPVGKYFQPMTLSDFPLTEEGIKKEVKITPFSFLSTQKLEGFVPVETAAQAELFAIELEASIEDAASKFFAQFKN